MSSVAITYICPCKLKTGYIDADTDTIRCQTCDGTIEGTEGLTMAKLAKYNKDWETYMLDGVKK